MNFQRSIIKFTVGHVAGPLQLSALTAPATVVVHTVQPDMCRTRWHSSPLMITESYG